jgi:phosphoglycolate phosphatase
MGSMVITTVVFDLDGTLLDTIEDIAGAVNHVLQQWGRPTHPVERYRQFIGDGIHLLMRRSLPEADHVPQTIQEGVDRYRDRYKRNWNVRTRPFEGISAMLADLSARGLKLGVLSNKLHAFTERCVHHYFPEVPFDHIMGMHDAIRPKPDAAGALKLLQRLGSTPQQTVFVGDAGVDMQTALATDMFPVGVLWGYRSQEELERNGAAALIAHPNELVDLIRLMN